METHRPFRYDGTMRKLGLAIMLLLGGASVGAASLTWRLGYTETTLSETCLDNQLTFSHEGLTCGVRLYSAPTWQVALGYRGTLGKHFVWETKGEAMVDEYGSVLDTEATIGPKGRLRHFYGGLTLGAQAMARFHEDMDKPLVNLNLAAHLWLGAVYGPVDFCLSYDSSTLFLYAYQWLSPIITLDMHYQIDDWWSITLTETARFTDAAPNELASCTLIGFSIAATRRF